MPSRVSRVLLTALLLVAVTAVTRSAAAHDPTPRRATLATFVGYWWGHSRGLKITSIGRASERINSGCCTFVLDYTFQLTQPRGTVAHASVAFRVTSVKLWKRSWTQRPRPRVGQYGELRLRHGVITDALTGDTFCAPQVGKCGA
jgi:hypothetical protein